MHEKMFESRMFFTDKLVSMGARIILCDPHRVVVVGPSDRCMGPGGEPGHPGGDGDSDRGTRARRGKSRIRNAAQIERGTRGSTNDFGALGRRSAADPAPIERAPRPD